MNWKLITAHFALLLVSIPESRLQGGTPIKDTFCIDFTGHGEFFANPEIFPKSLDKDCASYAPVIPSVYAVQGSQAGGDFILNNWLHYELRLGKLGGHIVGIIIQAESDEFAGFGQFFSCPPCFVKLNQENGANTVPPLATQFIPCKLHSSVEPLPSNVFVYTRDAEVSNTTKLAERPFETLHLFWKFSHNMCNHPLKITFRGAIVKQAPFFSPIAYLIPALTIILSNKFPAGGPSPSLMPDSVTNVRVPLKRSRARWVYNVDKQHYTEDYKGLLLLPECVSKPSSGSSLKSYNCRKGHEGMPRCRFDGDVVNQNDSKKLEDAEKEFKTSAKEKYSGLLRSSAKTQEYRNYVEERLKFLCTCPKPERRAEKEPDLISMQMSDEVNPLGPLTKDVKKVTITKAGASSDPGNSLNTNTFPGSDVDRFRIIHALCFIVSTMFVTPLSLFVTRHYKETFLRYRIIYNKLWFMIHIICVIINLQLHICGWFSIFLGQLPIGRSIKVDKDSKIDMAQLHRLGGLGALAIYCILVVFGAIRPVSKSLREVFITFHWLLGWMHYLACATLIVTSCFIQGSPSSQISKKGNVATKETIVSMVKENVICHTIFAWIILDFLFHIMMTIQRCVHDNLVGIKRIWAILPIPVLKEFNRQDLPGSLFRGFALLVYISLALLFCGFLCYQVSSSRRTGIWGTNGAGHIRDDLFGPMSCTSEKVGGKKNTLYKFNLKLFSKCQVPLVNVSMLLKNVKLKLKKLKN